MNRFLVMIFLWVAGGVSYCQVNRYMVFFTNKNNLSYSLDNPGAFLSQRALDRRKNQGIALSASDLPVNPDYVSGVQALGAQVFYSTRWFNGVLIQCQDSLTKKIDSLSFVKKVEYVAPGARPMRVSRDSARYQSTITEKMNSLTNEVQNDMLGMDTMHLEGYTGDGVLIAVLDVGFPGVDGSEYFRHLFTGNKILGERDFVTGSPDVYHSDSHGTEVLSCIAADKPGIYEGAAYNASFILCITEDDLTEYRVEEYNWVFGAEYADSLGVDIISSSLGYNIFDDTTMNYTYAQMNGNTAVITRAADLAAARGILCVVSVGNDGNDSWKKLVAPADADSVISVGAVDANLQHAFFSSYGPSSDGRVKPEVAALGYPTALVGPVNNLTYGVGTSYSTPLVSGLAAGLWQAYPGLTNMELRQVIEKGSSNYNHPDSLTGFGIPDFKKIKFVITALSQEMPGNLYKVYPNPVLEKRLYVQYRHDLSGLPLEVGIFNTSGKSCFSSRFTMNREEDKIELDLENLSSGIYILLLHSPGGAGKVKLLIP